MCCSLFVVRPADSTHISKFSNEGNSSNVNESSSENSAQISKLSNLYNSLNVNGGSYLLFLMKGPKKEEDACAYTRIISNAYTRNVSNVNFPIFHVNGSSTSLFCCPYSIINRPSHIVELTVCLGTVESTTVLYNMLCFGRLMGSDESIILLFTSFL